MSATNPAADAATAGHTSDDTSEEVPTIARTPLKSQRFVNRMLILFCGLLLAATVTTSGALGEVADLHRPQLHVLLGLITAVAVVLAHTLSFFYLIETAINLKRAVEQRGLDQSYVDRHTPLKKRVWPIAFWSMVLIAAAAILGGGLDSGAIPRWIHRGLAYAALIATIWAWIVEDRVLGQTRALIEEANAIIRANSGLADDSVARRLPAAELPVDRHYDPEQTSNAEVLWMIGRWMAFIGPSMWLWYGYRHLVLGAGTWPLAFYVPVSIGLYLFGTCLIATFRYDADVDGPRPPGDASREAPTA